MKRCSKCRDTKALDQFRKLKTVHNGETYFAYCKPCEAQRVKKSHDLYAQRYAAAVQRAKAVPCMDCGGTFPSYCMDFDHRDPREKHFYIGGDGNRKPISKLLAEIAKCDVVCANCHRIRTYVQREAGMFDTLERSIKSDSLDPALRLSLE